MTVIIHYRDHQEKISGITKIEEVPGIINLFRPGNKIPIRQIVCAIRLEII